MSVVLSWRSYKGETPLYQQKEKFDNEGSIGRAPDNKFVLHDPDKYVSRYHASIYEVSGNWFIKDTSSTVTVINNSVNLQKGQQFLLSVGDLVTIGESVLVIDNIEEPIEIKHQPPVMQPSVIPQVSAAKFIQSESEPEPSSHISEPEPEPVLEPKPVLEPEPVLEPKQVLEPKPVLEPEPVLEPKPEPVAIPVPKPEPYEQPPAPKAVHEVAPEPEVSLIFDIDDFFGDTADTTTDNRAIPEDPSHINESLSDNYQEQYQSPVPSVSAKAELTPNALEPTADVSNDTIALRAFLRELGMEPSQLIGQNKADVMRVAGVLLRTLTEGMMGVLSARTLMKEKLELDQTQIRQAKNNAFKFSSTPEEALVKMLTQESGYMDPVIAATEAVDDAKAHQLAMISGLNVAIQQTIESFDPKSLEEEFEVGFALSKKAKYWDIYCQVYETIAENAQSDSSNIFIKHFKEHYELQISKLGG